MSARQSGLFLGALILTCAAAGCAASAGQVRASKPHARVLVRIEHGAHDDEYLDSLYLDGLHYGLVSGDPMLLRLSPGKHELQLVSQRIGHRVQFVSATEYALSCGTPTCRDSGLTVAPSDRLELRPVSEADCVETLILEVKAGENVAAALVASPDGTCRTRG